MVHLKYGNEQAISGSLIKEAGSALGRWMASNRGVGGVSGGKVDDISRDYLSAPPVRSCTVAVNHDVSVNHLGLISCFVS